MATSSAVHDKFAASLSPDERMLVTLRDDLYGGSWDQMLKDLRDRLTNKPYIFKLVNRIQDDINRITKLSDYERKHKINLAGYLKKQPEK